MHKKSTAKTPNDNSICDEREEERELNATAKRKFKVKNSNSI